MSQKINVGIVGATGYTALELMKLLLRHPSANIVRVTSRDESRPPIGEFTHLCATALNSTVNRLI